MKKKKVCVIGCGFISYAHIRGWQENGLEVVALCDLNAERLETRAQEFGVKNTYLDYIEMIDKEELDIIDIATPVKTHRTIMSYCIKHAKYILIEKPFVDNIQDGKYLVHECEKFGCTAMVCQSYRWHPWYEQIKKELDSGIIGRPYYANIMQRVSFDIPTGKENRIPLVEDQPFYRNVKKLMLLEQGCHYIDVFRYFFGEPQSVNGYVDSISPYVIGDDLCIVIIKFNDTVAVLEDLWCTNGQEQTSVTFVQGEKGSIYFNGTAGAAPHRTEETGGLEITLRDGTNIIRDMDAKDYYARCFTSLEKHFIECIKKGIKPITSVKDNLKTLEIAFKAYESSKVKKTLFIGGE
jgi:predicted dehydrogenase